MNLNIDLEILENFDQSYSLPQYETDGAAGMDIRAMFLDKKSILVKPFERILVPTGLKMAIPSGFEMQVRPRSGISLKTGLLVVNSPGTIDSDYRGEIKIIVGNISQNCEIIHHGDRIAQILFAPVVRGSFNKVSQLSQTQRGIGGFGSTGKK